MIGKKTLKAYEFKTIYNYYDYIVESRINGNYAQLKELIKSLSSSQWIDFVGYMIENGNKDHILTYIKARCQ